METPYFWLSIFASLALLAGLIALAWIDAKTYRLPNVLTWPLIAGGLVYQFIVAEDFYPYLVGAIAGYGVFWCVETGYRILRKKDGLGRGDAKLLASGGAWCGWMALPFIVLLASLSALVWVVVSRAQTDDADFRLPFGPFLAAGIAVVWCGLFLAGR